MVNVYENTTVRDATGRIVGYEPVTNDTPYNALGMIRTTNTIGQTVTKPEQTPLEKLVNIIPADNPNQPVQINPNTNTSNIDKSFNQPGSATGKQWAFGNPDKEGVYKPVGNVNAELQGITHSGTLYKSDTGRWQVIDKRGQLVMSGSPGADLPRVTDYDSKTWLNQFGQAYASQGKDESITAPPANTPTVTPPTVTPPKTLTLEQQRALVQEYANYNFGPSLGSGYNITANGTITYYGNPQPLEIVNGTVVKKKNLGPFGALAQKHRQTHKPSPKPIGFMDIFVSAKKTVKKPAQIKRGSGLSYENLLVSTRKPSKPIKSPIKKPVKAPIKKPTNKKTDVGFGNAYEVLFSNKRRR